MTGDMGLDKMRKHRVACTHCSVVTAFQRPLGTAVHLGPLPHISKSVSRGGNSLFPIQHLRATICDHSTWRGPCSFARLLKELDTKGSHHLAPDTPVRGKSHS